MGSLPRSADQVKYEDALAYMKRWRNQLSTFTEPGDPPECEAQARFLRSCSSGARCSTLERERVPALFPPPWNTHRLLAITRCQTRR
jgi:hypothetical protein